MVIQRIFLLLSSRNALYGHFLFVFDPKGFYLHIMFSEFVFWGISVCANVFVSKSISVCAFYLALCFSFLLFFLVLFSIFFYNGLYRLICFYFILLCLDAVIYPEN